MPESDVKKLIEEAELEAKKRKLQQEETKASEKSKISFKTIKEAIIKKIKKEDREER